MAPTLRVPSNVLGAFNCAIRSVAVADNGRPSSSRLQYALEKAIAHKQSPSSDDWEPGQSDSERQEQAKEILSVLALLKAYAAQTDSTIRRLLMSLGAILSTQRDAELGRHPGMKKAAWKRVQKWLKGILLQDETAISSKMAKQCMTLHELSQNRSTAWLLETRLPTTRLCDMNVGKMVELCNTQEVSAMLQRPRSEWRRLDSHGRPTHNVPLPSNSNAANGIPPDEIHHHDNPEDEDEESLSSDASDDRRKRHGFS